MNPSVKIVVSQRFPVPAERVYDAWLDPEWIAHWMAGADVSDERIVQLDFESRVGGKFSIAVDRHGVEINQLVKFLELDRPDLLVFTWNTGDSGRPGCSRVVVEIVPCAGGCELTLTHVMAADRADLTDKAAGTWRTQLAALASSFTEKSHPIILKAS